MRAFRYRHLLLFVAVIAMYIGARCWHLGDSCLWFDEIYSVQAAERPWSELLNFIALDLVHPPLFYIVLKLWIGVGGESVIWLRSLPVLFSCLSIAPIVLLARELKLRFQAILITLFFLAANGALIKYAQEVRMYTMLMFVSLCSLWLFTRLFYRGKGFAALVVTNVVMVYIHYYGWGVIGAEVLALLILQPAKWRRIALAASIAFAAFIPWALTVYGVAKSGELGQNIGGTPRPGILALFNFVFDLVEPFYFQVSSAEPASIYRVSIPVVLIILGSIVAYAATRNAKKDEQAALQLLLIFSLAPVAAAFIASWVLPYSVWGTRHLIVVYAPAALLMACVICEVRTRSLRVGALSLLILFTGYAGYLSLLRGPQQYVWCGWEGLVTEVRASGELPPVYTSEDIAAYHSWFSVRNDPKVSVSVVRPPEGEFADKEYFLPRGFYGVRTVGLDEISGPRIILLYRVERPRMTDWLFTRAVAMGYSGCPSKRVEYPQSTLIRVEMVKPPEVCGKLGEP